MSVRLSASAEDARVRAVTGTGSAAQVSAAAQTLAGAGEQMGPSIAEIARNAGEGLR